MSDREFNNYLTLLAGLLRLGEKQRRAIAEELRTHLEDRLEELLARSISREEAVQRALAEFGDAAGLAAQFASISRGRRRRWLMRVTTFSVAATLLIAVGIVTFWPGRNAGPGPAAAVAQAPGGQAPGGGKTGEGEPGPAARPAERMLEAALNKRIDAEFVETPLKDALSFLSDRCGIQFVFRRKALDDAGIPVDAVVTLQLKQVRLNTLLELMLQDLGLVHTEKDDLLLITTPEDAEATLEIRVYDCRDLLAMPEPGAAARPGGPRPPAGIGAGSFPPGGFLPNALDPNLPGPSIEPTAPGSGFARPPAPSPAGPQLTPPGAPRLPGTTPRPSDAAARPPATVLPQMATPDGGAFLAQGFGGVAGGGLGGEMQPQIPLSEHEMRAERLISLITTNVNPQSWTDAGGAGSISEYHGLIVVTQTAQTHKKVEQVLNMLRQAADLNAPQGRMVR